MSEADAHAEGVVYDLHDVQEEYTSIQVFWCEGGGIRRPALFNKMDF